MNRYSFDNGASYGLGEEYSFNDNYIKSSNFIMIMMALLFAIFTTIMLSTTFQLRAEYNALLNKYNAKVATEISAKTSTDDIVDLFKDTTSTINMNQTMRETLFDEVIISVNATTIGKANDESTIKSTSTSANDHIAQEPIEQIIPSYNFVDIAKPSGLSIEQLNSIIDKKLTSINKQNSQIKNIGELLYNMEKTYGVNALFCLSVGSLESGYGTSQAAYNKNNLFGIMSSNSIRYFESIDEGINYFGKLISTHYIGQGRTTVASIQSKYCPGSTTWSNNVTALMSTYSQYIE